MLRHTLYIHLSLGLPLLRFPSGSHSKIFSGSLITLVQLVNKFRTFYGTLRFTTVPTKSSLLAPTSIQINVDKIFTPSCLTFILILSFHLRLDLIALGGVIVIVLTTESKLRGFKPGRERWIFRAMKIRSTTSFGVKIKPSSPCRKILRHIKVPYVK
jgi:hypothetical protein